jgi:hypothetical protein
MAPDSCRGRLHLSTTEYACCSSRTLSLLSPKVFEERRQDQVCHVMNLLATEMGISRTFWWSVWQRWLIRWQMDRTSLNPSGNPTLLFYLFWRKKIEIWHNPSCLPFSRLSWTPPPRGNHARAPTRASRKLCLPAASSSRNCTYQLLMAIL